MYVSLSLPLDSVDVAIRGVAAMPDTPGRIQTLDRLLDAYARSNALTLPPGSITKWQAIHPIEREQLDRTPFGSSGVEPVCSSCGEPLPTEGAFARHFVVTDRRYLNLGYCPNA